MHNAKSRRVWTVAEAKARLSEILRLAETEGPQHIGVRKSFVVVLGQAWAERETPRKPFGRWLVENTPRGANLEVPSRHESGRMSGYLLDTNLEQGRCYPKAVR